MSIARRMLALFLAVVMLFTAAPIPAHAAEQEETAATEAAESQPETTGTPDEMPTTTGTSETEGTDSAETEPSETASTEEPETEPASEPETVATEPVETEVATAKALLTEADTSGEYPELTLGTAAKATFTEDVYTVTFRFTAPESHGYRFYSTSGIGTYAALYDSNMEFLNDNEGEDWDFSLTHYLTGGETYYLETCYSGDNSGEFSVYVKKITELSEGTAETVTLSENSNPTWFQFTAAEDHAYTVWVEGLEDGYGELLTTDMEYLTVGSYVIVWPLEAGETYLLRVGSYLESGSGMVFVEKTPDLIADTENAATPPRTGNYTSFQFVAPYDHSYTFQIGRNDAELALFTEEFNYLEIGSSFTYAMTAGDAYFLEVYFDEAFQGDSLAVEVSANHNYSETILSLPTCTEDGLKECTCPDCGYSTQMAIPAGHSYEAGICTVCGAAVTDGLPSITMDAPVKAVIDEAGETVMYLFTPLVTAEYTFYADSDSDTYGWLLDSALEVLAANDDGDDVDFSITYSLTAGKTYVIKVSYLDGSETGSFSVYVTSDDEVFSYPVLTEAAAGKAVLENKDEYAWFTFIPEYSHKYTFGSFGNDYPDTEGWLYDSNMTELAYNDEGGSYSDFSITYFLEAGKLYILSTRFYGGYETGSYSVKVTAEHDYMETILSEPTCTKTGKVQYVCTACGYTKTETLPKVHQYVGGFCVFCEEEYKQEMYEGENWYQYGGIGEGSAARGVYYITPEYTESYTFTGMYGGDTVGYLYDSSMKLLVQDDDSASDASSFEITYTLKAGKTYTLIIEGYAGTDVSYGVMVEIHHEYEELYREDATCTEDGYLTQECTICGYVYEIYLSAEHTFDNGVVTEAATCTENGVKTYTCTICQETETSTIYAKGHIYENSICTVCGDDLADNGTAGVLTWFLDNDGTLTISGSGAMDDYAGSSFSGTVAPWREHETYILSVVIEEGVTGIGSYAFYDCTNLREINLPESLVSIGEKAFCYCISLESVYIPAAASEVVWSAFSCCSMLTSIQVDEANDQYTNDENGLIYSKDGTMLYLVPSSIGGEFAVPAEVVTIASGAFVAREYDSELTAVIIPDNVKEICDYALGDGTDYNTTIRFVGDAPAFGDYAFDGYDYGNGFGGIVLYPAENETWTDDVLQNYGGRPEWIPYGEASMAAGSVGSLEWTLDGNGLLTISGSGPMPNFQDYEEEAYVACPWADFNTIIKEVVIEDGITSIGTRAFYDCSSLKKISIPDSVTSIGNESFEFCSSLQAITLPDGLLSIGYGAFEYCRSLKSVDIPASIQDFGYGATFAYCSGLETVTLPESWTAIPERIFRGCTSLVSVDIPDSVVEIRSSAFSGCSALESVVLPERVHTIGAHAFFDCESLKAINLPNTVTSINHGSFSGCASLTEIDLPDNLTLIGAKAFYGCSGLTEIEIPATVKKIYWGAFAYCTGLTEMVIPDGIPYLGGTFWGCSALEQVEIPNSVTNIAYWTFMDCTNLPAVEMPTQLKTIGTQAFYGSAVEEISFFADSPEFAEAGTKSTYWDTEESGTFAGITATVYYPDQNDTWTQDVLNGDYGGTITWVEKSYTERVSRVICENTVLLPGQKTTLMAKCSPGIRDVTVFWTLPENVEEYAAIQIQGSVLTITANTSITEEHVLTILAATEECADTPVQVEVTILPRAEKVALFENGEDVTGETRYFDLNCEENELVLAAKVLPADASQNVVWTSSNEKVATVAEGVVTFTGTDGKVKITAAAQDGSGKSASVTIQTVRVPHNVEKVDEVEGDADIDILGGKSRNLVVMDKDTNKALTAKQITWRIPEEYAAFASVNAKGRLTTKKVVTLQQIRVEGTIVNSADDPVSYIVDIYPAVTYVEIFDETDALVNGQTLKLNFGEEIDLNALVYPADAMEDVTWKSSNSKIAAVDADGVVCSNENNKSGTVTITATANDGSKKKATVKIQVGQPVISVTITEPASYVLRNGKSMTLKAVTDPVKPSVSGVTWAILSGSEYASISASGSLKAKTVYEQQTVTVIAISKDAAKVKSEPITITILPKADETLLLKKGNTNVTGQTLALDSLTEGASVDLSAWLTAVMDGATAETGEYPVTWKTSSDKIAALSSTEGESVTVTLLKAGTATITASANVNGKTITAKVTVKGSVLVDTLSITAKETANLTENGIQVASGKAVTLVAKTNDNAASKKVVWSITKGGEYASISTSGKLTAAKNLTAAQTVTVLAAAADGSGKIAETTVTVRPIAQGVQVYTIENGVQTFTAKSSDNVWVRNSTTAQWDLTTQGSIISLNADVYPFYTEEDARNAMQTVIWKSSAPKVADFVRDDTGALELDENGNVQLICHKTGKTSITVTAQDGSKQKVSFTLNVVKNVYDFHMESQVLAAGKSLNLAKLLQVNEGTGTTTKKCSWAITGGDGAAYATLSISGILKAKTVTGHKQVIVTVTAQDSGAYSESFSIDLYPATKKVTLFREDQEVTGKTLDASTGDTFQLTAQTQPGTAAKVFAWTSSKPALVSVDSTGKITVLGESGTVTITCTATDGTKKKATVTIRIG